MTNSVSCTLLIFHTPVFKTLCSLCFPHSTLLVIHNSLYTTPHLACPSSLLPRAVSRPNSLLLLPCVRSRERIPFPFPVERLPRRLQRTPRFPQSTLFVFHTLHYTALSLPRPSLLPRAPSRAQISFPFHFERLPRRPHRTPRFPHPALLLLQTTIYTASKIDFLEFICRLSYNRWRCLATLKFFSKDSKTAI